MSRIKRGSANLASPSRRIGSGRAQKPGFKAGPRQAAPAAPKPEPDSDSEGEPLLSDEPLLAADELPQPKSRAPVAEDKSLISPETLYADEGEDPRKLLRDAQRKKAAPPSKEKKGSSRAVKPALRERDEDDAGDEEESRPARTPAPPSSAEAEDQDAEDGAGADASNKVTQRMTLKATQRLASSASSSKGKTQGRSLRGGAPKQIGFRTKHMVLGGLALVVFIAIAAGYDPALRAYYLSKLDSGATLEDRKAAAASLYERYKGHSVEYFRARFTSPDENLRGGAVHGLELAARDPAQRKEVIDMLRVELPGANTAGKQIYLAALARIAKTAVEAAAKDGKEFGGPNPPAPADAERIADAVAGILPLSEPAESKEEVRGAAVESLAQLRVPGVCAQLVKLAAGNDEAVKGKARQAIAATALPDAAGALLNASAGPDKALGEECLRAFVAIRDRADAAVLVPLVGEPNPPEVRKQIVEALGKRKSSSKAAEGIALALKDKLPEIRLLAVKAVPLTGLPGTEMGKLDALVNDADEAVSIANAETLGALRDSVSEKVVLQAFKHDLQGPRLEAYVQALGKRSSRKNLEHIGIVMRLLESKPDTAGAVCRAMVKLTLVDGGSTRERERQGWDAERWKKWHANILEREKIRGQAHRSIAEAATHRDADRGLFPKFMKQSAEAVEALEQCIKMSKPDDVEDVAQLEAEMSKASTQQDYFLKHSSSNERR